MKLLLNDKEIAHFLNDNMNLIDKMDHLTIVHAQLSEVIYKHKLKMNSKKANGMAAREYYTSEQKKKFAETLRKAIVKDLNEYTFKVQEFLQRKREYNFQKIHKNIESMIPHFKG